MFDEEHLEEARAVIASLIAEGLPKEQAVDTYLTTFGDNVALEVKLARRSFADFCRRIAPSSFVFGAAHLAIFDFIEQLIDGKFTKGQVNLAPRFGKSMIASVFLPAYLIGRFPSRKIIHLCNNLDLTRQFSEQLVALLQSEAYAEIFPWVELIDASSGRINFRDRREGRGEWGRYFVGSVKKAASGHGAHFLIVDDPLTEMEANSKMVKDAIWARWTGGFATRVDPVWNRMLLLGTRWARDDLFGRVISQDYEGENQDLWKIFKVPVTVNGDQAERINKIAEADAIFREQMKRGLVQLLVPGGTCSPERFGLDFVAKKRAELPPEQFAALYMQEPAPETGIIFQQRMFRACGRDMYRGQIKPKIKRTIMSCDLAFKADEMHDQSALVLLGVIPNIVGTGRNAKIQEYLVILDCWMDRVQAVDLPDLIRHKFFEWEPSEIIIEDAASGTAVLQDLRRAGFPTIGFNPRKRGSGGAKKEERAQRAAMLIGGSPIFYEDGNHRVKALVTQMLEFPRSDFDDGTDAVVQSILFLRDRDEFDSSWELWHDNVEALAASINGEDDEVPEARRRRGFGYGYVPPVQRDAGPPRERPFVRSGHSQVLSAADRLRAAKAKFYGDRNDPVPAHLGLSEHELNRRRDWG